jgi:aspartyl-tRNA(Asn)/glutamyl-tRNA(Gln) amidotransferase subunit A
MARYDGVQYGAIECSIFSQPLITLHLGLHVPPPSGSDQTKNANVYAHTRSQGFGREVQKRILLGTYALTAESGILPRT